MLKTEEITGPSYEKTELRVPNCASTVTTPLQGKSEPDAARTVRLESETQRLTTAAVCPILAV
eukprot:792544-Rhodomonas_salina.1